MRVLIASGERDTATGLGDLLRSEGVEVRLASGGMQVPRAVAEFIPDAVLMDLAMPDHGGLDVAQELLRCYGEQCPVLVAVSSRSSDCDRQRAASSGFQHFVAQPYDPRALLKLVLSLH